MFVNFYVFSRHIFTRCKNYNRIRKNEGVRIFVNHELIDDKAEINRRTG